MIKRIFQGLVTLFMIAVIVGLFALIGGVISMFRPPENVLSKPSILALELDGIIMDGSEFLKTLAKYRKMPEIKGVLITINSPGGVVGPSQEIHREIKRTSQEFGKPVYTYCRSLAASGAYYAAVGSDRIYTTPGCFLGSIGVVMEFVNLEKLYSWAKVERYALTTGPLKDTGADYRPMRPDERGYLQAQLQEVLEQFKAAVQKGRKLKPGVLDENSDGRVMSGAKAVELGFADEIGTWEDARKALGEKVGLGPDPQVFRPRKPMNWREFLSGDMEDYESRSPFESGVKAAIDHVLHTQLKGQPLFIFPAAIGL